MKATDSAFAVPRRFSLRFESNLAWIFGVLGLMLTGLIAFHWFVVLEPALRAEAESRSTALAQAQVQDAEKLFGSGLSPAELKRDLQEILGAILLPKDMTTGLPLIQRITLKVDYELFDAPVGSLDLTLGAESCADCFVARVPLYHPQDGLLVAFATCYSSRGFLERTVADLRAKLLWVVGIIVFLIGFAWLETNRLLRRLRESEANLRHVFEAAPYPMVLNVKGHSGLRQANQAAKAYLDLSEDSKGNLSSSSWVALCAAGLPDGHGEPRETRIPATDGSERWALVSVQPMAFSGTASRLVTLVDVSELKATQDELRSASFTDALTGLYNRRYLYLRLAKEIDLVKRYGHPLSVILFDLDHFKKINDTFGHRVGDDVLVQTAAALRTCVRDVDVAGRYGGEEFLVILPHSGARQAFEVAERIRTLLKGFAWPQRDMRVTISGGVCQYAGETLDEFIDTADRMLYEAKESGRNQVVSEFY